MLKKVIIIAGGYGTRLFPLTKNFPKALLEVNEKPVIAYILEKLKDINIEEVFLVTNNKFFHFFEEWVNEQSFELKISLINDGTNDVDDKLGAIGDINYVINEKEINEDVLIIGGDNLFEFSLKNMIEEYNENKKSIVSLGEEENIEKLKQLCSVKINENNKIIFFEEKPENPTTKLFAHCIYLYTKEVLEKLNEYMEKGNNPDQPGRFVQWLYDKHDIYGYVNNGKFIDVGTKSNLKEAREDF